MKEELDLKLTGTFPKMYRDRYEDMRNTCMCWGFSVCDGWFDLIWNLSEAIQRELNKGDLRLREDFRVVQVKEKFGGLRFYYEGGNKVISKFIQEAEGESYKLCESCGKPGEIQKTAWIVTLCDDCFKARQDEDKKAQDDYEARKKRK